MVTQFERSHRTVCNHTVTLTSWYDEVKEVWQTSAPSYMHLSSVAEAAHAASTSRNAGLAHLTQALESYFAPTDLPTDGRPQITATSLTQAP